MSTFRLMNGDVLAELAKLPDESVQCGVTSPPYWGLRDYKIHAMLSSSSARKAASARIAKIPLALARHIARCYYPSAIRERAL